MLAVHRLPVGLDVADLLHHPRAEGVGSLEEGDAEFEALSAGPTPDDPRSAAKGGRTEGIRTSTISPGVIIRSAWKASPPRLTFLASSRLGSGAAPVLTSIGTVVGWRMNCRMAGPFGAPAEYGQRVRQLVLARSANESPLRLTCRVAIDKVGLRTVEPPPEEAEVTLLEMALAIRPS